MYGNSVMLRKCKEQVRCPVGDDALGERFIEMTFAAYCEDCKVTYYFKANEIIPYKNLPDNQFRVRRCGCGSCSH